MNNNRNAVCEFNYLSVNNFDSHSVRTITIDGEPWFVASDVYSLLDISYSELDLVDFMDIDELNHTMIFDEDEVGMGAIIVSDLGLYQLIDTSISSDVKPFKRWIMHEVVPAIRNNNFSEEKAKELLVSKNHVAVLAQQIFHLMMEIEVISQKLYKSMSKIPVSDVALIGKTLLVIGGIVQKLEALETEIGEIKQAA